MGKIVFFCIAAYGHTNPTVEVVRELTRRGHEVHYYSFEPFREKLEGAGAVWIGCDAFLPPAPDDLDKRVGRDFSLLIDMTLDMTKSMEKKVLSELSEWKPDCLVSDSMCMWGKLYAQKLKIPYICSTTTFAFNQYTARGMKRGLKDILSMIMGMGKINKKIQEIRDLGYEVPNMLSLIQNDNDTNTIVFTSKEFQPLAETFSGRYHFTGPSVAEIPNTEYKKTKPVVYISLGTVNNKNEGFYHNCIEAFRNEEVEVILSVGEGTEVSSFLDVPEHIEIKNRVVQMEVLKKADVFLTHCGMNSVNESIYSCVPMVFFPQQNEQGLVAQRAEELGCGIALKKNRIEEIRKAVLAVLADPSYQKNTERISKSFHEAGGAKVAADAVEGVMAEG